MRAGRTGQPPGRLASKITMSFLTLLTLLDPPFRSTAGAGGRIGDHINLHVRKAHNNNSRAQLPLDSGNSNQKQRGITCATGILPPCSDFRKAGDSLASQAPRQVRGVDSLCFRSNRSSGLTTHSVLEFGQIENSLKAHQPHIYSVLMVFGFELSNNGEACF